MQSLKGGGGGNSMVFYPANNIDPNRFCLLEKEFRKLREDAEFDKRDRSSQVEVLSLIRPSRSRWTTSTRNSSPVSTRSTSRAWSRSVIS